ncbi:hypothetical protein FALBO_3902 [Fusarium albosuccineum]|uniref:Uncharacterized protein n=1 Tax=Fusarium albosuccineum TaxID=1237068 RepID=A0A8H4LJU8_9HYPO|nr:hypothetical protein FALBO_3902 [Fusarium albosuccineum]
MSDSNSSETVPKEPNLQNIAAKIDEYRKTMKAKFSGSKWHPWREYDRGWEPRLRIFHLDQGAGNYTTPSLDRRSNASHPWQDLEQAFGEQARPKPCRRLILLEGIDPRIAEALSIKLSIPPEFWVAHSRKKWQLTPLNPSGVQHTSSTYWRVVVPMYLSVVRGNEIRTTTSFDLFVGNCHYGLSYLAPEDPTVNAYTHVSFWGKYTADGWIAFILMDAPVGFLRPRNTPAAEALGTILLQPFDMDLYPNQPRNFYAVSGSQSSENRIIRPYELALWDMAIPAYEKETIIATDDPFSSTTIIRNFIYCKWEDFIQQDYAIGNTIWASGMGHIQETVDITYQQQNDVLHRSREIAAEYQKLRVSRQVLQQIALWVRHINRAFRCNDNKYPHSQSDDTLSVLLLQESRNWTTLLEHIRFIDELVSGNMAMYAQRAAMEEAYASRSQAIDSYTQTKAANEQAAAANRTARSSGQLAKIATVAVPCTVAASIFSMNGDFAAGERLFFVYWCVAVPLTVVLLSWVIQKDFAEWRRDSRTNRCTGRWARSQSSWSSSS